MASFNIHGQDLKPGQYRREGLTIGAAYLVVCSTGDAWYVDRRGRRYQPPQKAQVVQLFNTDYPRTRCVPFSDPPLLIGRVLRRSESAVVLDQVSIPVAGLRSVTLGHQSRDSEHAQQK